MPPITLLPLALLYQVCWYAAATLIWLAAMGSPVAREAIQHLTRKP